MIICEHYLKIPFLWIINPSWFGRERCFVPFCLEAISWSCEFFSEHFDYLTLPRRSPHPIVHYNVFFPFYSWRCQDSLLVGYLGNLLCHVLECPRAAVLFQFACTQSANCKLRRPIVKINLFFLRRIKNRQLKWHQYNSLTFGITCSYR